MGLNVGTSVTHDMLQAITLLDVPVLEQGLRRLVEAELLHQQGLPPQATYVFKHALIQDVTYQSLLKHNRRDAHRRIAEVLEQQFPEIAASQPERLARHYTEAERPSQAVLYWRQAGRAALERHAYMEAILHSRAGLEQLKVAPPTAASIEHELVLQCTFGMAYTATKGFAAPEVEQAYGRALTLCRQVSDFSQLLPVLGGLRTFYLVRGELRTARELAEKQLDLALQQDPMFQIPAYTNLGSVLFFLGDLGAARDHMLQGRERLRSVTHYHVPEMRDSRVNCLVSTTLALLLSG